MSVTHLDIKGSATEGRLTLVGEIDAHSAPTLDGELADADPSALLVLDLAQVSFIDSSGLRTLVATHSTLADGGGKLELRNASDAVRKLLSVSGLDDHLNIV